jgi:hypothetical protein
MESNVALIVPNIRGIYFGRCQWVLMSRGRAPARSSSPETFCRSTPTR